MGDDLKMYYDLHPQYTQRARRAICTKSSWPSPATVVWDCITTAISLHVADADDLGALAGGQYDTSPFSDALDRYCGDIALNAHDGPTPLSRFIARLDQEGFTAELLAALWRKHTDEAKALGLQTPTGQPCDGPSLEVGAAEPADAAEGLDEPGTDWRDIQQRLLTLLHQGEPFTTQRELADRLGCALATISKAIHGSDRLTMWAKRRSGSAAPKAEPLTEVVMNRTSESRECSPADALSDDCEDDPVDARFRRLLDEATPDERAEINGMPEAEQRELAKQTLEQDRDAELSPVDADTRNWKRGAARAYKRV